MIRLSALSLLLAGCLSVPDSQPVECKVQSDCDTANGEVCEEGTCWGNPPAGPFAVLITPPGERKTDSVAREMIVDSLPADGYFGDLELGAPATLSGQIVCPNECANTDLGASIVVTRPSSFVGGPSFRQVFDTDPRTGAFQLVLPRVLDGEPSYTMTVIPEGRDSSEESLARQVPPLRTILTLDKSEAGRTIDLGSADPRIIEGSIVDANDNPATNYRVVALGRWEETSPLTEVSTVDIVGLIDNSFAIRLSEGIVGSVEIVAQPIDDTLQPTLRMMVNPTAAQNLAQQLELVQPVLESPIEINVDVRGTSTGGNVANVIGAHVTVRGRLAGQTEATFVTTSDTDESGRATLKLPGGALTSSYRVSVVPAPNSPVGMVFDRTLDPGGTTQIKLPDRIAIVGVVVDAFGDPLKDVQVTAAPSLRFQWSLEPDPQAFSTSIPAASVVTTGSGEFVLYVDQLLAAGDATEEDFVWGFYDLLFVPGEATNAPLFTQAEVEIPRDPTRTQLSIGTLPLPDAAHIHGRIVAPSAETVEGAEIKLFRVEDPNSFTSFCDLLTNAPPSCPVPALQLGRGISDADGIARLTLPRL